MMDTNIIIIILIIAAFIVEAVVDKIFWDNEIRLAKYNGNLWNAGLISYKEYMVEEARQKAARRKWHIFDAIYIILIIGALSVSLFSFTWYTIYFMVMMSMVKRTAFNMALNIFKGEDIFHLSNEGIEGWFKDAPFTYYLVSALIGLFMAYLIIF